MWHAHCNRGSAIAESFESNSKPHPIRNQVRTLMKPTSHKTGRNQPSGENQFVSRSFPITDSSYQSVTLDGYRGGCANRCESFRDISADYFKSEARRSFVTEA